MEWLRKLTKIIIEKVKLKNMIFEEISSLVLCHIFHYLDICHIQCRSIDIVLIGKSCEEVSSPSSTVPDIVFILIVLSEIVCHILLTLFYPNTRRKISSLSFSNILRDDKVSSLNDIFLIFFERRSLIIFPKEFVFFLVLDRNGGVKHLFKTLFCNPVSSVIKNNK